MQHELANPWMLAVYIVAMIAICWHFSYGVWLFAAKWGITPGTRPASALAMSALALGLVLAVMGLASIWAFVGPMYRNAPENPLPALSPSIVPAVAHPAGPTRFLANS